MATIGLCMIVKDEARVIAGCIESVRPLVDYVLIVDTGSTDGTQEVIRACLRDTGLPGEVIDEPWQDFATNRTSALVHLRTHRDIDYALINDADDRIVFDPDFDPIAFKATMTSDLYEVEIRHGNLKYYRPQILRNSLPFCYRGVLHEFVQSPPSGHSRQTAAGFHIRYGGDGARSQDPKKFVRDAALLERALQTERDPFLISRYTFYLGQSYRDAGEPERALAAYLRRPALGYWDQEIFISLLNAARLKEQLGHPEQEVLDAYLRAAEVVPARAEALHGAAKLCRLKGRNQQGYEIGKRGLSLAKPTGLFVEQWIHDYGLKDEFSINAYWAGHYKESLDVCLQLLSSEHLPEGERARVTANAKFASDKIPDELGQLDIRLLPGGMGSPELRLPAPVIAPPRTVGGRVSIITPTFRRDGFLQKVHTYVRNQDYNDIEWLILDDSPSDECSSCETPSGPNISYERVDTKLSIGEKRNRLIEKAKGEIIVQFDDDDYYAPTYTSIMLSELASRKADMINLRGWFLYDVRSMFFGYWNLEHRLGPHYLCEENGVSLRMFTEENNVAFSNNHFGYGFSYVFRKDVWRSAQFPHIDWNEDGEFSLRARSKFKVDGIHDRTGICLHILHQASSSRCFPQHHLPGFVREKLFPTDLFNNPAVLA